MPQTECKSESQANSQEEKDFPSKIATIEEEVDKLLIMGFKKDISHVEWLNFFLVKKKLKMGNLCRSNVPRRHVQKITVYYYGYSS